MYSSSPSTTMMPDMPPAVWAAESVCGCGWYQYVPGSRLSGKAYEYWNVFPGSIARKTLSELPPGETCMPWTCRFVWLSSLFSNVISMRSPGRNRSVGGM